MIEQTEGYTNGVHFAKEVIGALQRQGVDDKRELTFSLYLYLPSQEAADACATVIRSIGYACVVEESAIDDGSWLCFVTARLTPTQEKLEEIGALFLDLAASYSGNFDGWEVARDHSVYEKHSVDFSGIAHNILSAIRGGYLPAHEYEMIDPNDFDDVEQDYYSQMQSEYEPLGFEFLVDIEDLTVTAQGNIRTFIRVLRQPATNSLVCIYYVPPLDIGICELETFLTDGSVIVSTTAPQQNEITDYPRVSYQYYPTDVEPARILDEHIDRVVKLTESGPASVLVTNFDELVTVQNKMNQLKYDHLKSIGWVTKEYLLAQAGGDSFVANGVFDAIQELLRVEV